MGIPQVLGGTAARLVMVAMMAGWLYGCEGGSTGLGLHLVSAEQVDAMGLEAWQQIRSETPVSGNSQYQQRAQRVADQVLKAAGENPGAWEVVVFQGEDANAFALPGGKIGVYEGMLRLADRDEQLAAVIGHEIAHNESEHAAQRVNSQMATELGLNIASVALGVANVGSAQTIAALLGAGAQYGLLLPYSRNQELEADRQGLGYMARAGYNPEGAIEVWEKMKAQGGGPPAFLSTHPAPEDRIEQLQAMLPEAMESYRESR